MLPAMSRDEILAELIERPREAYVPLPDLQVIARPGWRQLVTPSVKGGGLNDVSLAQLGDDVDAVIDATIAQYRGHGCKFVWRVGPDSTPDDLGERLARRGLVRNEVCAMARATEMAPPELRVELVDESTVELFTQTMAKGWEMDPAPMLAVNQIAVRQRSHFLFLAHCDGVPAATAGAIVFARSVYLLGGVTLPEFRGRGLYRALVAARLQFARERGIMLATSHARATTSAPILERLGFETMYRYATFATPSG